MGGQLFCTIQTSWCADCRATRELKRVCPGCKISGGVSNIAFGFRGNDAVRRGFHSAFLHHACKVHFVTILACGLRNPSSTV
jgi:hypothetical protein